MGTLALALLSLGAAPLPPDPKVYRMFVGPDRKSHIELIHLTPKRIGLGIEVGSADPRASEALMKAGPVNLYQAEGATVDLIGDPPRATVGNFHWASRRALVVIVRGRWEFGTTDGKVVVLEPGDFLRVEDTEPGIGHTQRVIGPEWGLEMAAFEKPGP